MYSSLPLILNHQKQIIQIQIIKKQIKIKNKQQNSEDLLLSIIKKGIIHNIVFFPFLNHQKTNTNIKNKKQTAEFGGFISFNHQDTNNT